MMRASRLLILLALPAAALPLGACATDGYGGGGGFAYDSTWGDPYWGWYGDYYYPGTGIYVYDHQRRRHRWSDDQRHHWEGRRGSWHGPRGATRPNWHDFGNRGDDHRPDRRPPRGHRGGH